MVVWSSFHPARPSSAFSVSLPSLPEIASPFRTLSSMLMRWMGILLRGELEPGGRTMKLMRKMKLTTPTRKMRKRRFARGPEGGMGLGGGN